MKVRGTVAFWLLVALSLGVSSCGRVPFRYSSDLAIYDLLEDKVTNISSNKWREIVIGAWPQKDRFLTLTRLDEPILILRERNADGAILRTIRLPFFRSSYAGHNWIRSSSDMRRVVFYDEATKGLSMLDLESQEVRVIATNIVSLEVYILMLEWISDEVVLMLVSGGETGSYIVKINVNDGSIQKWVRPVEYGFKHSLSESKKLLALVETYKRPAVIVDVETMEEKVRLPVTSSDPYIGEVRWFDGDRQLAIWDVGEGIFAYDLNTGEVKRVTPQGDRRYFIHGAIGKWLVVRQEVNERTGEDRLLLYDVGTRKSKTIDVDINGCVYPIAGHRKLVMEVGY